MMKCSKIKSENASNGFSYLNLDTVGTVILKIYSI